MHLRDVLCVPPGASLTAAASPPVGGQVQISIGNNTPSTGIVELDPPARPTPSSSSPSAPAEQHRSPRPSAAYRASGNTCTGTVVLPARPHHAAPLPVRLPSRGGEKSDLQCEGHIAAGLRQRGAGLLPPPIAIAAGVVPHSSCSALPSARLCGRPDWLGGGSQPWIRLEPQASRR